MLSILYKQFSSDADFHMNNLQDFPFAYIITNYPRMLLPRDLPICECWLACRIGWLRDRISCRGKQQDSEYFAYLNCKKDNCESVQMISGSQWLGADYTP
jgi:hypothetical protein